MKRVSALAAFVVLTTACPGPPSRLPSTTGWAVFERNVWSLSYPPGWHAGFNTDRKWGAGVIANTNQTLRHLSRVDMRSDWNLAAIGKRAVYVVLDQPITRSSPAPDTPLPLRPRLTSTTRPLVWSGAMWHSKIEYTTTIFAGTRATRDDLEIAGAVIRSLRFRLLATPPPIDRLAIVSVVDVAATDANRAWALAGLTCVIEACPLRLFSTVDGGRSWRPVRIPRLIEGSKEQSRAYGVDAVRRIWFADSRDGWLFGDSSFVTHDGGRTWTRFDSGSSVIRVTGSAQRVWELADTCSGALSTACRFGVRTSVDRGRTWSARSYLRSGSFPLRLVAAGDTAFVLETSAPPPGALAPQGTFSLERTTDAGRTWRRIAPPPGSSAAAESVDIAAVGKRLVLIYGSEPATIQQFKWVWGWNGARWAELAENSLGRHIGDVPSQGYLPALFSASDGSLWMVLGRTGLWYSPTGARWHRLPLGGIDGPSIDGLSFVGSSRVWAAMGMSVWTTSDRGTHWFEHRLPARASS